MYLKPYITQEFILKYITEEDIFERYLGVSVRANTSYINPLPTRPKPDRNPGCNFYRTPDNKLLFKDWAWKAFNCWGVVMELYNLNYPQALEKVAEDFGLVGGKVQPLPSIIRTRDDFPTLSGEYTPIQVKRKKWSDWEVDYWQLPDREVTIEELEENRIYSISHYWMNGRLSGENLTKTFGYYLHHPDYWQIYRPVVKNKAFKFRQSTSASIIGTSYTTRENYIICTKSYKDVFILRLLGFNAVTVLTENIQFKPQQVEYLNQFNNVILLFDNDEVGITKAQELSTLHNWNYLHYPTEWGTKDSFDTAKRFGGDQVIEYLWENLEPIQRKSRNQESYSDLGWSLTQEIPY